MNQACWCVSAAAAVCVCVCVYKITRHAARSICSTLWLNSFCHSTFIPKAWFYQVYCTVPMLIPNNISSYRTKCHLYISLCSSEHIHDPPKETFLCFGSDLRAWASTCRLDSRFFKLQSNLSGHLESFDSLCLELSTIVIQHRIPGTDLPKNRCWDTGSKILQSFFNAEV